MPERMSPSDNDAAAASATRTRIADELADEPVLIIGTHYSPPSAGYLVRGERGVWLRT
ncbi:MAG: hypothetical protein QOH60_5167 [Mycobacterium sp.]|jgi:hypothetical protein|nr:hypothetical protein [Mycobacterium sp.]